MCYDSARGVTVLFGGRVSSWGVPALADTWEWDGASWTHRVVPGPVGRYEHAMAYDSARGRVVLHGGRTAVTSTTNSQILGDTWEWTGSVWVPLLTTGSPGPRRGHVMAFDPVRQRTVLVGRPSTWGAGETWEYNGYTATWSLVHSGSPASDNVRTDAMAYHPGRQRVMLVVSSGSSAPAPNWEWDGTFWQQRFPATGVPSLGSGGGSMVYDSAAQKLVLVAMQGWATPAIVWEWDGGLTTGWQQRFPAQLPSISYDRALSFDSARSVTVAFGSNLSNAWEFDSLARAANVANYGAGCGQPVLQVASYNGSRPLLGSTFLVDIAPVASGAAFMSIGFSREMYGPFALPLPLDGIGMTGCLLHHDFAIPLMGCPMVGPATARFALALPASQQFLGLTAYLQAAALAPGINPAGLIASNGVEFEIGSF